MKKILFVNHLVIVHAANIGRNMLDEVVVVDEVVVYEDNEPIIEEVIGKDGAANGSNYRLKIRQVFLGNINLRDFRRRKLPKFCILDLNSIWK